MAEIIKPVCLHINAREATPAPPIGSTLAPKGIKIMDFCKEFNDKTKDLPKGAPIPVKVYINKNKTFTLKINKPLTSYLLKQKAQLQKGSSMPNKDKVGSLTLDEIRSIAEEKLSDLNVNSMDAAVRTLIGSARSMGIEIREASNE